MKIKMMMIIMMTVMVMAFCGCSGEEAYYDGEGSDTAYEDYEGDEDCDDYEDYGDDGYEACGDYDDCVPCDYNDDLVDAASCSEDDYTDECYEEDCLDDEDDLDEDIEDDYAEEIEDDYVEDIEDDWAADSQNEEWVSIFDLPGMSDYMGEQITPASEANNDYDERGVYHPYHMSIHVNGAVMWGTKTMDIEFYNTDYDTLALSFYPKNRHDDCTTKYCYFEVIASDTGTILYTSPEYRYGDYGNSVEVDISQYHNQHIVISPQMPGDPDAVCPPILNILTDGIFVK